MPPIQGRREGDINSVSSNHSIVRTEIAMPVYATNVHAAFERPERRSHENDGILRRRNISGPDDGIDGASEHSGQGFDGTNKRGATLRVDAIDDRISYTENTLGGFHDPSSSVEFIHDFNLRSTDVDSKISPTPPTSPPPEHLAVIDVDRGYPAELLAIPSNPKNGAPAPLPRLRRVTPFSKRAFMSCGRTRENIVPTSKTVSRTGLPANHIIQGTLQNEEIRVREDSFHDDRTLLPSQRK